MDYPIDNPSFLTVFDRMRISVNHYQKNDQLVKSVINSRKGFINEKIKLFVRMAADFNK